MQNINETVSILKHHVDTALNLIQSLKKRNSELESDNKLLLSEHKRNKADIAQHNTQVKLYEEKMKSLEILLDGAQKEQSLLERSVLNAISNLGVVHPESIPTSTTAPTSLLATELATPHTPYTNALSTNDILGIGTEKTTEDTAVGIF